MPHIHYSLDWTVSVFCTGTFMGEPRVLLVHHKKLATWLPPGGHVEINELPDDAAIREFREETGLQVRLVGPSPGIEDAHARSLILPMCMDVHRVTDTHRHIAVCYRGRLVDGQGMKPTLCEEHHEICWFTRKQVAAVQPMLDSVRTYANLALDVHGRF